MSDRAVNPTVAELPANEWASATAVSGRGSCNSRAHSCRQVTKRRDHSSASFRYTLYNGKPMRKVSMTLTASSLTGSSSTGDSDVSGRVASTSNASVMTDGASTAGSVRATGSWTESGTSSGSLSIAGASCADSTVALKSKAGTSSNAGSSSNTACSSGCGVSSTTAAAGTSASRNERSGKLRSTGLSAPGSAAASSTGRVSAGATDGSNSLRAEVNSAKSISSVTAPPMDSGDEASATTLDSASPSGISVDWKSSCGTSSEMSIASVSSIGA